MGSGAGTRVMQGLPNILRVTMFDTATSGMMQDQLVQLSCDIDDMTGEELGAAADTLRATAGVVDVLLLTASGKKSRPVVRIDLLVQPDAAEAVAARMFDVTSTLGLRRSVVDRLILPRSIETTPDGTRRKRTRRPAGHDTLKVESDDLTDSPTLADRRTAARKGETEG